jgi:hypothetical protein
MPETLFAFAADLHLRDHAWVKHPTLCGDAYESFQQILNFCGMHRCPLLLGGDILDQRNPDPDPVRQLCHRIRDFAGEGMPQEHVVYYIQGDHEFSPTTPWPQLSGVAHYMHGELIEIGPFKIYGMDWTPMDRVQDELAKIPPEANTLLTHLAWSEIQGIGQTSASLQDLPPHITTVLTGDYHVHLSKVIPRPEGQAPVVAFSPGSTCMQAIDENPAKQFWVCEKDERGQWTMQSKGLATRRFYHIDLATPEAFDQWITSFNLVGLRIQYARLSTAIRKPAFRIRYNDCIPEAHRRLVATLGDHVHLFEEPYHVFTEVEINVEAQEENAFDTLTSAVRTLEDDDDIVRGTLRLLNAADPAAEIETMYREFCDGRMEQLPAANLQPPAE